MRARATRRGAVFVLSDTGRAYPGPQAAWISTAGWAGAAERRFGSAPIVTPEGCFTAAQALERANRPVSEERAPGSRWRRRLPRPMKILAGDLLRLRDARRFRQRILGWTPRPVPRFVWQRHALFAVAGIALAKRLGVPALLSIHAPGVRESASRGFRRPGWAGLTERCGERAPLRQADVVACVSPSVAEFVAAQGVPDARIVVAPNGVDADHFRPMETGRLRRRLGLEDAFIVGWTGSFRSFHDLDLAVKAVARLPQSLGAALLLVGSGETLEEVRALASRKRIRIVLPGAVSYRDLPRWLSLIDVALVLARGSDFHYAPLKLREYMSCARAVVAPSVGEIPLRLRHGETGVLVAPGDPDALADAIVSLHDDPMRARRLGRAARQWIVSEATWDVPLEITLGALRRLGWKSIDS